MINFISYFVFCPKVAKETEGRVISTFHFSNSLSFLGQFFKEILSDGDGKEACQQLSEMTFCSLLQQSVPSLYSCFNC